MSVTARRLLRNNLAVQHYSATGSRSVLPHRDYLKHVHVRTDGPVPLPWQVHIVKTLGARVGVDGVHAALSGDLEYNVATSGRCPCRRAETRDGAVALSAAASSRLDGTTHTASPLNALRQTKPCLQLFDPYAPLGSRFCPALAFSAAVWLRLSGVTQRLLEWMVRATRIRRRRRRSFMEAG